MWKFRKFHFFTTLAVTLLSQGSFNGKLHSSLSFSLIFSLRQDKCDLSQRASDSRQWQNKYQRISAKLEMTVMWNVSITGNLLPDLIIYVFPFKDSKTSNYCPCVHIRRLTVVLPVPLSWHLFPWTWYNTLRKKFHGW